LRSRVLTSRRSVRAEDVTWSVAGLLGSEAGTMLADRLLAPLLTLEPERRDTLLGVLRAWLGENGSWDATAKSTGLHRNSVRRQIGVIAELLGLDLNQAQARAELWIALQYIDLDDQGAPDLPTAGLPGAAMAGAAPEFAAPAGQIPQER
jgi:purine catabolism regulator